MTILFVVFGWVVIFFISYLLWRSLPGPLFGSGFGFGAGAIYSVATLSVAPWGLVVFTVAAVLAIVTAVVCVSAMGDIHRERN